MIIPTSKLKIACVALSGHAQAALSTVVDRGLNGGPRPLVAEFFRDINAVAIDHFPQQLNTVMEHAHCVMLAPSRAGTVKGSMAQKIEKRLIQGPVPCILLAQEFDFVGSHLAELDPRIVRRVYAKGRDRTGGLNDILGAITVTPLEDEVAAAPSVMAQALTLAREYAERTRSV